MSRGDGGVKGGKLGLKERLDFPTDPLGKIFIKSKTVFFSFTNISCTNKMH